MVTYVTKVCDVRLKEKNVLLECVVAVCVTQMVPE